jgi:glycolate oxidase iron-sulfur subunit
MYARPADSLVASAAATEAAELIRRCVHCGFCLPACPTYLVTGSELDSPRGRIYLVRQLLEQGSATATTRTHLDRCLTCLACETACPSGVQYGRLVDLGRDLVARQPPPLPRSRRERWLRSTLLAVATRRELFRLLVRAGRVVRPVLPAWLRTHVPDRRNIEAAPQRYRPPSSPPWPAPRHTRRMAVLEGCVQPALAPEINAAAARVLDRLGFSLVQARGVGCCGALDHHLGQTDLALRKVRANVEVGARLLDGGVEAIVSTASGCGVFAKDYAHALRHEPVAMQSTGARVAAATRDLSEVVDPVALAAALGPPTRTLRVAWQSPCTLQHGQRAATAGKVEAILRAAGCELVATPEPTLCCGSAGTYSVLQQALSHQLRSRKLAALTVGRPDAIATANIGCLEHLRRASVQPVLHWIEIVAARLDDTP